MAKAMRYEKKDNEWTKTLIEVETAQDIQDQFGEYSGNANQIKILDGYTLLCNCIDCMKDGIDARCKDVDDITRMLVSPIIIVHCDDERPIDITNEVLEQVDDILELLV